MELTDIPQWLSGKELTCSAGDTGDVGLILGGEDPLEKGMATHPSVLTWRIPWTEESGGATVHGVSKSWTGPK